MTAGALDVRVREYAPDLDELDPDWVARSFEGQATAAYFRHHTLEPAAGADVIENLTLVASARSTGRDPRLRALFFATRFDLEDGPRMTVRVIAPTHDHWHAHADAIGAVIDALVDECRRRAIPRLIFWPGAPSTSSAVEVQRALGMHLLPGPPNYQLHVPPIGDHASRYDAYLASMRKKRRYNFKRDLDRVAEAQATIVFEPSPSAQTIARAWPLLFDLQSRMNPALKWGGGNLLAAAARRLPDQLVIAHCSKDDRMLGFDGYFRVDTTVLMMWCGHVPEPGLHVYSALTAHILRAEMERGAEHFILGFGAEDYKQGLGAEPVPRLLAYRPIR